MLLTCILAVHLHTAAFEIGGKTLVVEIADTPKVREKGLMGRTSLSDGEGMLFIFEKPQVLSFWMKGTLIPLSIGFFDSEKRLIDIVEMVPPLPGEAFFPSYHSSLPAQYALEAPQNWFKRNKIQPGMKFTLNDRSR